MQAYAFAHPGAARIHCNNALTPNHLWLEIETTSEGILFIAPTDEVTLFQIASISHVVPKLMPCRCPDKRIFYDRIYNPKVRPQSSFSYMWSWLNNRFKPDSPYVMNMAPSGIDREGHGGVRRREEELAVLQLDMRSVSSGAVRQGACVPSFCCLA